SSVMETGRISEGLPSPDLGGSLSDKKGFLDAWNQRIYLADSGALGYPNDIRECGNSCHVFNALD
ncbi:MAG TPA: hypothetical protein VG387_16560, partial [Rhizomicrobium sp.]|nr:hypothetical protein [Rhizomicrobium sp.]